MTIKNKINRSIRTSVISGAALAAMSVTAAAADLGTDSYKDEGLAAPVAPYSISVNGGLTTDYVFRGFSQSDEDPAAFVGADFSYQWFYAGVWASSIDDFDADASVEVDFYAGLKKTYGGVDFDLGLIYYAYPGSDSDADFDYLEIKGAVGTTLAQTVAVTGTVYYSPEYFGDTGEVWTLEGKASAPLPVAGLTVGGTVGHVISEENAFDDYTYWNAGLSKTFLDNFTVDVRYWDTDFDGDPLADERVVGTISFSY